MVNPLDGVLHVRYQTPRIDRGTNNYGDQEVGTPCPPPLIAGKSEAPNTGRIMDVSRGTLSYFNQAIYLGGGTAAQDGSGGGMTGGAETSNVNKQAVNRAASFIGKTYALIGSGVYVYDDSIGGSDNGWSLSLQLLNKNESQTDSLGLYPVFVENTPYLIGAYYVTPDLWRSIRLNGLTNTWTISASQSGPNPTDANGGILTECQYKSRIYFSTSDAASYYWYDFITDTFGSQAWNATPAVLHPMDFCSFMGQLYVINKDAGSTVRIWKINPSNSPEIVASYPKSGSHVWGQTFETLTSTSQYEGRPLIFVDNVYDSKVNNKAPVMYTSYICHAVGASPIDSNDSNHGLHHIPFRADSDGGLISQEVAGIGYGFRANPFKCNQNQEAALPWIGGAPRGVPSRKDERMVLRTFVDQKTRGIDLSEKTAIVIGTRFAGQACAGSPGGGGDFTNQFYHKFVGSGNRQGDAGMPDLPTRGGGSHTMEYIGMPAKGTRHRAAAHERHGGGARYHTLDGNSNRIADIVYRGVTTLPSVGIVRINYNIIPSLANPTGSTVAVRWFYDENLHAPETNCTLIGTSHGSLSGNFIAATIPVESGTIYYVDWDAKTDGLSNGKEINLNAMIILNDIPIGPIESPSGIEDLVTWFEANDVSTITSGNAGEVSEWFDKTALGLISGIFQYNISNQPTAIENANNGLWGIRFTESNNEFLFSSGSPIETNDASTIMVIYEPISLTDTDTILSFSNDVALSGTIVDAELLSMSTVAGGTSDIFLEIQDATREALAQSPREITLASGAEINKTRLLMWTELSFEGEGFIKPSGDEYFTDITTDGYAEATGLSNTSFGRFSGAQISGIYNEAGQYFDGIIYEVAVYNRSLSAAELDKFRIYAENKYSLDI